MAGENSGDDARDEAPAGASAAADGARRSPAATSGKAVFYCTVCGSRIMVPVASRGLTVSCPYCRRPTPVPADTLSPGETSHAESLFARERILSVWMRFLCPHCKGKLGIDARAGGAWTACPRCGRDLQVPLLPGLISDDPAAEGGENGAEPPPVPESEAALVLSADEIQYLSLHPPGDPHA